MGIISTIYKVLSLFNDVTAASKGTYHKRYMRKQGYKFIGKLFK